MLRGLFRSAGLVSSALRSSSSVVTPLVRPASVVSMKFSSQPSASAAAAAAKPSRFSTDYEWEHDDTIASGDPSRRAFTYFVLGGARFVYASFGRLAVLELVQSLNASADVLALASVEVDISGIPEGAMMTLKWRGKPVFIKHRTATEIADAESVNIAELRHQETDASRAAKPNYLIVLGVCTHLGCVPLGNAGDYAGGWFCPCHGSHYDSSARIRRGPAPLNLEIPPYKFLENDTKVLIG